MLVLLNVPTPLFTFSANLVSKRRLYHKPEYNSNKAPTTFPRALTRNSYIFS